MADDGWYHYPTDAELSAAIDRNPEDGTYVLIDEGVWAWFGDQADAEAAAASLADTSSLDEIAENYGANAARAAAALRAADGSDLEDGPDLDAGSGYGAAEYAAGTDQDLAACQGLSN